MKKSKNEVMERIKQETARDMGLSLGENGAGLTAQQAGALGGRMVKRIIEEYAKESEAKK